MVNIMSDPSTPRHVYAHKKILSGMLQLLIIDHVAGEIIRLVASVCVRGCVSVCLSVGTLLFEPFDLWPRFFA